MWFTTVSLLWCLANPQSGECLFLKSTPEIHVLQTCRCFGTGYRFAWNSVFFSNEAQSGTLHGPQTRWRRPTVSQLQLGSLSSINFPEPSHLRVLDWGWVLGVWATAESGSKSERPSTLRGWLFGCGCPSRRNRGRQGPKPVSSSLKGALASQLQVHVLANHMFTLHSPNPPPTQLTNKQVRKPWPEGSLVSLWLAFILADSHCFMPTLSSRIRWFGAVIVTISVISVLVK